MNALRARLEKELGDRVRTDVETRGRYRHDRWVLSELLDLEQGDGTLPLAVVEVRSTEDVQRTLALCRELRLPVLPYGGGSGVCGALRASERSVILATRGLEGLIALDDTNLVATFAAGTLGSDAEQRVQAEGLTIGQWPQSIDLSTVGGWVATREAGQYSTGYGSIEDVLFALEVVLPDGSVVRTRATPRAAAGPDLRQLFLGSEGLFGVVTEVSFSLRPLPEASRGQAFHFDRFCDGLEAIRSFMRVGWRPPAVRLYDAKESQRHFAEFCPEGRHLLILLHEGPEGAVRAEIEGVRELCEGYAGAEADAGSVEAWLASRNRVPSQRELLEKGIVAETIEVACTWDRVNRLYEELIAALSTAPDVILASAHSSHSYRSGTNLYVTFAARPADPARLADRYRECWSRAMRTTLALGGGISHHHGIGRVRRDVLTEELGESGVELLRVLKDALDPEGLFNPGVLLPERPSGH